MRPIRSLSRLTLPEPPDPYSTGFSPDGRYFVMRKDTRLSVLDLSQPDPLAAIRHVEAVTKSRGVVSFGFSGVAQSVSGGFSPDGRLALGGFDASCRILDLASGDVQDLTPGTPLVPTLTYWGPECRWLIGISKEGIQLHNLQKLPQIVAPIRIGEPGQNPGSHFPVFLEQGRWMTFNGQAPVKMWDLAADDPAATTRTLPDPKAMLLTVVGNGRWLVTTAYPKRSGPFVGAVPGASATAVPDPTQPASLQLWDLQSKSFLERPIKLPGHFGWVDLVQSSPDGQWLITSCSRCVRFWHLPTVLAKQSPAE